MGRMIDADDFIEYLGLNAENSREENLGEIVTLEDFDRQPIIDAEPVRHGEWKDVHGGFLFECSECRAQVNSGEFKGNLKYCYNCGAKMDGAENAHIIWRRRHVGGHRYIDVKCRNCGATETVEIERPVETEVPYCSRCGKRLDDRFLAYCPACGARVEEACNEYDK